MADKNGVTVYAVDLTMENLEAIDQSDLTAGIIGNKDLALAEKMRIADSKAAGNASMTLGSMAVKTAMEMKQLREAGDKGRQKTDIRKAEIELQIEQEKRKTKELELQMKQEERKMKEAELQILQAQIKLKAMEAK